MFCFIGCFILWQEHQALNEKSESLMTTDNPIELTMNLHQSIQPIGNSHILAKKGNIPCSGRAYSYKVHTIINVRLSAGPAQN
jgi:hypothetical protein